jgi:Icc-related predicted phosphoesterase
VSTEQEKDAQAHDEGTMRIAAVADLHFSRTSGREYRPLFQAMAHEAEVILLCGDLTDYGLPEEAELLVEELQATVRTPVVAVLGNHDFEADKAEEVKRIFAEAGVLILDGDACELGGVGFAGVKGFAGGFGRGSLSPWGEPMIKAFVQEAIQEAVKLESALGRLRATRRVAVLHYAPIEATVKGERPEIFPYLGSSRLEEPLRRFPVDLIVHGHAHWGELEGVTSTGTPVFNVSMPLLRRRYPERMPFRLLEIPREVPAEAEQEPVGSHGS